MIPKSYRLVLRNSTPALWPAKSPILIFRSGFSTSPRPCHPDSRPRIIQHIQNDPGLVTRHSNMNSNWWRGFVTTVVISTTSAMSLFLAIEVAKVYYSDQDCRKNVYLPLWLGVNWPSQRKFSYLAYSAALDSDSLQALDLQTVQDSIPSRVLDCLFRSPMVRETFGIPLKLTPTAKDDFEVWIEPQYPTIHGLKATITKTDGKLGVAFSWSVKSLSWDVADCVQGTLWRLGSFVSPAAETHDYGSGRVHEIHKDTSPHICKQQDFKLMFRGQLNISSRNYSGVVLYKGTVDASHLDLNHGARLTSVDLKMSEGGSLILYKVFDNTHT